MTRKRTTLLALFTIAGAAALGALTHSLWAATPRPLPTPPKIVAGKFKPNPVTVGSPTAAHMSGIATPPEKVDVESLVALNWSWHVDKVQLKLTADGAYAIATPASYDVAITNGGSIDSNAILILKPKTAGFWKVTVHATATYANIGGEIFTGNSNPKDFLVTAIAKTDSPASQPAADSPLLQK